MIPPAAAPVSTGDLIRGISAMGTKDTRGEVERQIREYFQTESVFLVSSGKAALTVILQGLSSLSPRRKVLIPAYTCWSVPSAVLRAGLTIELCDVEPDTLDFDYRELERIADSDTLCIVPTHLFGIPSDIPRVRLVCEKNGAFLVEDAAQSMGVEWEGRMLGTFGDAGFLSLGRGKNVSCGSGGIILTSSQEIGGSIHKIYEKLGREQAGKYFRDIGEAFLMKAFLNPSFYWLPHGLPFLGIGETRFFPDFPIYYMSGFKAGVMRGWRERMEEDNRRRTVNGKHYIDTLSLRERGTIYSKDIPFLRFPLYADTPEGKSRACRKLHSLGVSPMYPGSLNQIEQLRGSLTGRRFPGAERIAKTLLTLPTHALLAIGDREAVCRGVSDLLLRNNSRIAPLDGEPNEGEEDYRSCG